MQDYDRGFKKAAHVSGRQLVLGIFGTLGYPNIHPFDIIGRHQMKDNPFYQEIMNEGRKETRRQDTIVAVEERFGPEAAAQVAGAVNALEDLTQLDQLFRLAIRCGDIHEFRQALEPATPHQPAPRARRSSRPRR